MLADLRWKWHDPRLRWEPTQYSDVKEVSFSEKEIWVADLEVLNS